MVSARLIPDEAMPRSRSTGVNNAWLTDQRPPQERLKFEWLPAGLCPGTSTALNLLFKPHRRDCFIACVHD